MARTKTTSLVVIIIVIFIALASIISVSVFYGRRGARRPPSPVLPIINPFVDLPMIPISGTIKIPPVNEDGAWRVIDDVPIYVDKMDPTIHTFLQKIRDNFMAYSLFVNFANSKKAQGLLPNFSEMENKYNLLQLMANDILNDEVSAVNFNVWKELIQHETSQRAILPAAEQESYLIKFLWKVAHANRP